MELVSLIKYYICLVPYLYETYKRQYSTMGQSFIGNL